MEELDLGRLIKICRLQLKEEERKTIEKDIEAILRYFDTIGNVKCDDLEPAYHPLDIAPKLREDTAKEFEDSDLLLKGTKTYRFFVVGPNI